MDAIVDDMLAHIGDSIDPGIRGFIVSEALRGVLEGGIQRQRAARERGQVTVVH